MKKDNCYLFCSSALIFLVSYWHALKQLKHIYNLPIHFKGYLPYKTIFCHIVALDNVINFFYLKKKHCFVLEISRFLCCCEIHRFQNLWRHRRHCYIMEVTLMLIFLNPKCYKNEIWSIFVCCITNISNIFLVHCWRLETSFRSFYDFIKITFTIFNSLLFNFSKKWNIGILT